MLSQDKKNKANDLEENALPIFETSSDKSSSKKEKTKDKENIKKEKKTKKVTDSTDLTASEQATTVNKEKTIFIVCACLLSPILLALAFVIIAFFLLLFAAILLLCGAMAAVLVLIAAAGSVLAIVGIVYGAILLFTGEGIDVLAGQYELGIGITITGITIIVSVLLYSGITELVPFLIKKTGIFFTFVIKKIKELAIYVYHRSTGI